ncbi:hypothetical protein [Streptomyces sp. NPDC048295]|uniref:hypothetical protein n=1 Tax=Streptomyces sp. NPDC048295 TaxID=3154617 RepID=UPI003443A53B
MGVHDTDTTAAPAGPRVRSRRKDTDDQDQEHDGGDVLGTAAGRGRSPGERGWDAWRFYRRGIRHNPVEAPWREAGPDRLTVRRDVHLHLLAPRPP